MLNEHFVRFGGAGGTFLTPLALLVLVVTSVLIFVLPRKYALAPFLLGSLFIPISQTVLVAGIHFMAYRILVTVVWLRIVCRGPSVTSVRLETIDKVLILWGISAVVTFSVLWLSLDAFVNRMGFIYDALGIYFLIRLLNRTEEDLCRTIKIFAVMCIVVSVAMLAEHFTRANPFSALGAFSQFPDVGDGRIRSEGPFAHPIIAGTCAAGLLPLFVGLWWRGRKTAAVAGMIGATLMTFTSASSTAIMAYAAGIGALLMWPLRQHLRWFRRGGVILLVALHLVMKAPVWALIGRVDLFGGSSSYHRFELINQAILHFWEWCLVGEKTTYQWGYNLWDTANTYVETAVTGGLSTLVLFIAIFIYCFKKLGTARQLTSGQANAKMFWAMGSALFANAIGFIGITYYDQAAVAWYSLIALICTATVVAKKPTRANQNQTSEIDDFWPGVDQPASVVQELAHR